MDTTWLLGLANSVAISAYLTTLGVSEWTFRSHRGKRLPLPDRAPRVTVFKPLAGADDDLASNLESFGEIDYPEFELLLGVASMQDAAVPFAKEFIANHKKVNAKLILTNEGAAENPKVAQLLGLERHATGGVFVISDSNVRVPPDYLWGLVRELEDPTVGIVTHVFAGTGERSLGAALENLQVCAVATPGVMAVDRLLSRSPTVGKSMAMRRRDLASIGGFFRVTDVLAEDQILGDLMTGAGFTARLCLERVENRNTECSVARTFERHTRWAQIRRALFPSIFMWEPFANPIVVAAFSVLLHPGRPLFAFFFAVVLVQTWLARRMVTLVRGEKMALRYAPLELLRSFIVFYCWCFAWTTRKVEWRGHKLVLEPGTKLVPHQERLRRPLKGERGTHPAF